MNKKKQQSAPDERAAYMIAWRDRLLEKQREMIKGYEQECKLLEALLAFTLQRLCDESAHTLRIPKDELAAMLGAWACEASEQEDCYLVRFFEKGEREHGKDATDA